MICEKTQQVFIPFFGTIPPNRRGRRALAIHETWRERLRATGKTDTDLALRLNKSKSALSRIMTGQRDDLRQSERDAIEAALADFEGGGSRPVGLIPLLGHVAARSNPDRITWALDAPLDWVDPPHMRSEAATGVFALRVADTSMTPRLFPGELIYAGAGVHPARGGDCIVEFHNDTSVIKSFEAERDGFVFCRQFNPEMELRYASASVRRLHAVLWRR